MFSHNQFFTHTLNRLDGGDKIAKILAASLNAVNPASTIKEKVSLKDGKLYIGTQIYELNQYNNIYVVGAGKAGFPMATAISEILGENLTDGIIIIKDGYGNKQQAFLHPKIKIISASHPLPDQRGVTATEKIIRILETTQMDDLVICLLSGGGSALLTAPSYGIELDHIQDLINQLLHRGATINEINILRKHLDRIKGGRLVQYASPAQVISLILSDVVGDPLDVIASGPTVPDPSTYSDAFLILKKYQLLDWTHSSIIDHIIEGMNGEVDETPKSENPIFVGTHNFIIGSNKIAAQAAINQAKIEGFNTLLLTTFLQGEASCVGEFLATIAKQLRSESPIVNIPACIICGGETTVVVNGDGIGGRNMELALGAAELLNGLYRTVLVSIATDGSDGSTDAAGAVVSGETFNRAMKMNIKPQDYLKKNDSYNFFNSLGDLLKPGFTRTNVNDLVLLFCM